MNILLPTDFSENADVACDIAFRIAQDTQGKVSVLNAYDMPYSDRSMSTSLLEVMKENAEKNMAAFEKKLKEKYAAPFTTQVRLGNPIRLIHEMADQSSIDMVVMGTKGASGLEEVLIGSNAASVIQNVNKPVLIIPAKADLKKVDKIIFASDLDPKVKELPLNRLRSFAQLNNAKVDIVHVQGEKGIPNGARDFFTKALDGVIEEFTILHGEDVEALITKEAEKEGADMIAAISKRYGFFEGLFHRRMTNRLAFHTRLPLLVLHEPK